MRHLLANHLARWWWVWALCLTGYGLLLWAQCTAKGFNNMAVFFPVWLFMGTALLSYDLRRGLTRVCLSLPVSTRELAHTWWWATVGLPTVGISLTSAGVYVAAGLVKGNWGMWPTVVSSILLCAGLLGQFFFLQTQNPAPSAGKKWAGWSNLFFNLLYMVVCFGWIKNGMYGDLVSAWGIIFFVAAIVLTIKGWRQAEWLVNKYAEDRGPVQAGSGGYLPLAGNATGPGGLGFLIRQIYVGMVVPGLFMVVWFAAIFAWSAWRQRPLIADDMLMVDHVIFLIGSGLLMLQIVPVCAHLRYLRTLPVSAGKLAGLLVLAPLAAILTLWAGNWLMMILLVAPVKIVNDSMGPWWMIQLGCMTLSIPVLVWRGGTITAYVILAALFGLNFWLPLNVTLPANPFANGGIALALVLASLGLTMLALIRGSRTYRSWGNLAWSLVTPMSRMDVPR